MVSHILPWYYDFLRTHVPQFDAIYNVYFAYRHDYSIPSFGKFFLSYPHPNRSHIHTIHSANVLLFWQKYISFASPMDRALEEFKSYYQTIMELAKC